MKIEREKIRELLAKHESGGLEGDDLILFEQLLEDGTIQLEDVESLHDVSRKIDKIESPLPSERLDDAFYSMLKSENRKTSDWIADFFSLQFLVPKLAFASIILLIGFGVGRFTLQSGADPDVASLSAQVTELKEMMMLSLLEKENVTDRLKAVNLSQDLEVSDNITDALFKTLNHDENVNVRLAALEALQAYVDRSDVREGLVRSIANQKSSLVQMSLAELMAAIQEKASVNELKKIQQDKNMPEEVRERIQESINVLI